jgi:hypothetical protein
LLKTTFWNLFTLRRFMSHLPLCREVSKLLIWLHRLKPFMARRGPW